MEAKIVVGLGFGDEGKGLVTNWLSGPATVAVRFSGGQQAGHTVQIGDKRHIHASYCSNALGRGISFLSEYCTFYLPNMVRERDVIGYNPTLYIHPLAMLTTPYDVAYNRLREKSQNHGSCGMGVGATMARNAGYLKLYALDTTLPEVLIQKMKLIKDYYERLAYQYFVSNSRLVKFYRETVEVEEEYFYKALAEDKLFQIANYGYLTQFKTIVFEGSQGILLDKDHGIFPNVTYANTTSKNALEICKKLGIKDIYTYYVTRCYLTRHGNGWMPTKDSVRLINNEKETNVTNEWQGDFRTCEVDYDLLNYALEIDNAYSEKTMKSLVVTCLDQRPDFKFDYEKVHFQNLPHYESYSPDSKDIKQV